MNDGIYVVIEDFEQKPADFGCDDIVRFSYRMIDSSEQTIRYIRLNMKAVVPLDLDRAPEQQEREDGKSNVWLTLTKKGSKQLRRVTRKHTGERVAVVIGGEAVTMHKIREPITGPGVQITRCTDDACRYLFYELRDNVQ